MSSSLCQILHSLMKNRVPISYQWLYPSKLRMETCFEARKEKQISELFNIPTVLAAVRVRWASVAFTLELPEQG